MLYLSFLFPPISYVILYYFETKTKDYTVFFKKKKNTAVLTAVQIYQFICSLFVF